MLQPFSQAHLRPLFVSLGMFFLSVATALAGAARHEGEEPPSIDPVPAEVASTHFTVTVGSVRSPVLHAVTGYYLLNFELTGPTRITVTADDPHYWDAGVEVQPMRLGIRPRRDGASITFTLDGPAKLSIERPGDYFSDSEMLFLFGNEPDRSGITADTPGVRYYGAGVHHENIDARSGDRIYLAPGALLYGSINIWGVHDVSVSGRGTVLYSGPQDPNTDEGWMHKPNWHFIVMDNAQNIHIEGITGIVRSRTWMIQMRDSHDITYRNMKVIGGSPNNANQDGMDWLGGGDTLVQDCFFRAADDVFSMEGNWDGYSEEALTTPGHEVSNITVERSTLSTSISNVVRLGWPKKIFDSHGFTLRDSDVIQMGVGGCGVPFALFELWADPAGKGVHTGIQFSDVRLDNWYSLAQIRQPNPGIEGVTFSNIWAMDGPGLVPSVLKGDVHGVSLSGVNLGGGDVGKDTDLPLLAMEGAAKPRYEPGPVDAGFSYPAKAIRPGSRVKFTAKQQPGVTYHWFFGDGERAEGRVVRHAFPDALGTLLDGTGRFRVLLSVIDAQGHKAWTSQSVVVSESAGKATHPRDVAPGLIENKGATYTAQQGLLKIPATGGYTVSLLTSTTASLAIDGVEVHSGKPHAQVCGSAGDAVQAVRLSLALQKGPHRIEIRRGPEVENAEAPGSSPPGEPILLWEGPGILWQPVPETALAHAAAAP